MSLQQAQALRGEGRHEEARELLLALCAQHPGDASIAFATACVHDFLGHEAKAVPHYLRALAGELPANERRSAYTGLGSTYRTPGRYAEAEAVLLEGLAQFPQAAEIRTFLALTRHNLGRSREAVQALLQLLAETSADAHIRAYARAIAFYAQDVDRTWPGAWPPAARAGAAAGEHPRLTPAVPGLGLRHGS